MLDVLHCCFLYRCFPARFVCSSIYLVDPASSHMLVSKKNHACLSVNFYMVTLRIAHQNSYSLFDGIHYMDTFEHSGANTCIQTRLMKGCVYWILNLPTSVVFLMIHDKIVIPFGDESFKFLTHQLSMVVY